MKLIIQRVTEACVRVNEELVNSIGRGLLILVGISKEDTTTDIDFMTKKVLNIKFFENDFGKKWCQSVMDKKYEILCVSQFTLCHSLKGNKLDFHDAMKFDESKKLYESFLKELKKQYEPEMIKDGQFGAYMQVTLCNDGPVTIHLMSEKKEKSKNYENCD